MSKVVYNIKPQDYEEPDIENIDTFEEDLIDSNEVEETVTLKSTRQEPIDTVPTQFSDVSDNKVSFSDFYHDTRSFLSKANSTKFILVSYLMLSTPFLLTYGFISEDVYREIILILAITYLGVDAYEKRSLVKRK